MTHAQSAIETKVGDLAPATLFRVSCSCSWRGAWWTTPLDALSSWQRHLLFEEKAAPAPSALGALLAARRIR